MALKQFVNYVVKCQILVAVVFNRRLLQPDSKFPNRKTRKGGGEEMNRLHYSVSQKIELFIITLLKTSNSIHMRQNLREIKEKAMVCFYVLHKSRRRQWVVSMFFTNQGEGNGLFLCASQIKEKAIVCFYVLQKSRRRQWVVSICFTNQGEGNGLFLCASQIKEKAVGCFYVLHK
jgi:hypothetical protein